MPFFFIYFLKLSISLAVVFLFYHFVLRKLTFYNWNRWYLLGYTLLSFFIPFIDISAVLEKNEWADSSLVKWVPVINNPSASTTAVTSSADFFTATDITGMLVIGGMLVLLVRLLLQFVSFRKMMKKAQYISDRDLKIYQVDENIIPFSFGNSIFINRHLHSETELQEIIRHEFVHVKQNHSIDIIWAEILCLLNWYNPFAWLIKKSIRQNLEFIADNKVLQKGVSKKEYQYLLLKVIGNNQYSIATPFNFSSLKKRIAMMNKNKSAKVQVVKFLFLVPIAAVILLAFRSRYERILLQMPHDAKNLRDTVPPPPAPPKAPAAMNLPENVEKINSNNGKVTVWLKNGNKEKYDLNDIQQKMEFDKKYGTLPEPPPPPERPKGVKDMSRNGKNIVTVTMENGKTEKFDLNNDSERNQFEKNYGKMPEPPTAPKSALAPLAPIAPIPATAPVAPTPPIKNEQLNSVVVDLKKNEQVVDASIDGPGKPENVFITGNVRIKSSIEKKGSPDNPLYVIDGVVESPQLINTLDPGTIQSINILKGQSATALYGEKGKNGVIIITTKNAADAKAKAVQIL